MTDKKIAWITPPLLQGGGGARTIIQNANFLSKNGFICDIYIDTKSKTDSSKKQLVKYFDDFNCNVYNISQLKDDYDTMIATYSINTPEIVLNSSAKNKLYFVQDFEPWFEPMGYDYLKREQSYTYNFKGISIGKWLSYKLNNEFQMSMSYFDFCADLDIYKPIDINKENSICFIHQPEKPRRCIQLGIAALRIVKALRPDTTIYFYGSTAEPLLDFPIKNLKLLSLKECNELYNKCKVGLCLSASNPSRIPFEMMAAGLPVVDLYRENNLYDYPDQGISLSQSNPAAIATAIIEILDNEHKQKDMGDNGINYMKDYPMNKGFDQFLNITSNLSENCSNIIKSYNTPAIIPSEETKDCLANIYKSNHINISKSILNKISISISNVFSVYEIKNIKIALWSDVNQNDLQWANLNNNNGTYTSKLNLEKKKYCIHFYCTDIYDNTFNFYQLEYDNSK